MKPKTGFIFTTFLTLTLGAWAQTPAPREAEATKNKYTPDLAPGRAPTDAEVAKAEQDVAAHPDDFHLVRKLGKAYFYQFFGDHDKAAAPKARKTLERAHELKKDDAETIAFLGTVARLTGRAQDGTELFKQALALDPDNGAVLSLLSGFGDVAAMEKLRAQPGFPNTSDHGRQRVLLGLGRDRARKGETDKARAFYEEGLKINGNSREAAMLKAELAKLK